MPHITIHFDIENDTLSAFAVWEGRVPASAEEKVGAFIAEFNWNMSAPTLSYDFRPKGTGAGAKQEEEEIAICANRAMGVGIGLSSNQLGSFVLSASIASAWLSTPLPKPSRRQLSGTIRQQTRKVAAKNVYPERISF
ncbi:hypothetical protein HT105_21720 [Bacteroides fragilis]|nr:hypothetical protein [Bacteroides fragilis]